MTLRAAIDQYVAWRQAQGARFQAQAYVLHRYSRSAGDGVGCDEVRSAETRAFVDARSSTAARPLRTTGPTSIRSWRASTATRSPVASAVHRLTAWYREGADVQRLLPLLSIYLGHVSVAATQVYLSMTPELLHEAALRFERYTENGNGGDHG